MTDLALLDTESDLGLLIAVAVRIAEPVVKTAQGLWAIALGPILATLAEIMFAVDPVQDRQLMIPAQLGVVTVFGSIAAYLYISSTNKPDVDCDLTSPLSMTLSAPEIDYANIFVAFPQAWDIRGRKPPAQSVQPYSLSEHERLCRDYFIGNRVGYLECLSGVDLGCFPAVDPNFELEGRRLEEIVTSPAPVEIMAPVMIERAADTELLSGDDNEHPYDWCRLFLQAGPLVIVGVSAVVYAMVHEPLVPAFLWRYGPPHPPIIDRPTAPDSELGDSVSSEFGKHVHQANHSETQSIKRSRNNSVYDTLLVLKTSPINDSKAPGGRAIDVESVDGRDCSQNVTAGEAVSLKTGLAQQFVRDVKTTLTHTTSALPSDLQPVATVPRSIAGVYSAGGDKASSVDSEQLVLTSTPPNTPRIAGTKTNAVDSVHKGDGDQGTKSGEAQSQKVSQVQTSVANTKAASTNKTGLPPTSTGMDKVHGAIIDVSREGPPDTDTIEVAAALSPAILIKPSLPVTNHPSGLPACSPSFDIQPTMPVTSQHYAQKSEQVRASNQQVEGGAEPLDTVSMVLAHPYAESEMPRSLPSDHRLSNEGSSLKTACVAPPRRSVDTGSDRGPVDKDGRESTTGLAASEIGHEDPALAQDQPPSTKEPALSTHDPAISQEVPKLNVTAVHRPLELDILEGTPDTSLVPTYPQTPEGSATPARSRKTINSAPSMPFASLQTVQPTPDTANTTRLPIAARRLRRMHELKEGSAPYNVRPPGVTRPTRQSLFLVAASEQMNYHIEPVLFVDALPSPSSIAQDAWTSETTIPSSSPPPSSSKRETETPLNSVVQIAESSSRLQMDDTMSQDVREAPENLRLSSEDRIVEHQRSFNAGQTRIGRPLKRRKIPRNHKRWSSSRGNQPPLDGNAFVHATLHLQDTPSEATSLKRRAEEIFVVGEPVQQKRRRRLSAESSAVSRVTLLIGHTPQRSPPTTSEPSHSVLLPPPGLDNSAQWTCYINSCVQAVMSCPPLIASMIGYSIHEPRNPMGTPDCPHFNGWCLYCIFQRIAQAYGLFGDPADTARDLVCRLAAQANLVHRCFILGQQGDPSDFVAHVFENLCAKNIALSAMFTPKTASKDWCNCCLPLVVDDEGFPDEKYLLTIRPSPSHRCTSLAGLLSNHFMIDRKQCDNCTGHGPRSLYFREDPPPILIIKVDIANPFRMSESDKSLDLAQYLFPPRVSGHTTQFELVAMIYHIGVDNRGHYIANVRRTTVSGTQTWWSCNDSRIVQIDSPTRHVMRGRETLYFYVRADSM